MFNVKCFDNFTKLLLVSTQRLLGHSEQQNDTVQVQFKRIFELPKSK